MASVASSILTIKSPRSNPPHGCGVTSPVEQSVVLRRASLVPVRQGKAGGFVSKNRLVVRAGYGDGGRSSSTGLFLGGFVLGGLVAGALACVYAPQISKALSGTDKKDLMKKLPKFIYDEEKALERTRKILTDKIAQLNSAIDGVSSQLRTDDATADIPDSDEIEAAV